ncbi:hypothetical protein ElyMa_006995600 [Elysia marginata]|uniref:Ig-like domain-containing protein n=1 Tax=Elysia marginata TaxID=1093978 RepID=A0AAV4JQB5_9GAST|nr:hypothetical protein ElyMa_006995600 [Elysia marginata]
MEIRLTLTCLIVVILTNADGQSINQTTSADDMASAGLSRPFTLTYSPAKVYLGITSDLDLRCARDEKVATKATELLWIKILKNTQGNNWVVVAEQGKPGKGISPVDSPTGSSSSSRMTPVNDSFLSVVWAKSTDDTLGRYKCLILGLDQQFSFVVHETPTVVIKSKKVSESDLLNIILDAEENLTEKN